MLNPHRLLVAEEDDTCRTFLADNLTADGYAVDVAATRDEALTQLRVRSVDLIVVDVNGKTLALLDTLRGTEGPVGATPSDVAMIVLTKHPEQLHRVRLLERGADDVIAKPFGYGELRARIATVLRRLAPRQTTPTILAGDVRVDLHQRQVTLHGEPVSLSATEYRLLCALGAEPTRVFTRAELLRAVWGYEGSSRTRTLDSHAHRLRAKLADARHPVVLNTWGVGYRLIDGAPGVI